MSPPPSGSSGHADTPWESSRTDGSPPRSGPTAMPALDAWSTGGLCWRPSGSGWSSSRLRSSGLPYVQSGHGPPDDHPLDFARSLEDREDPGGRGSLCRSAACEPRGISTDSARPVRDECRFRVGPCPVSIVVSTHAEKAPIHLRDCHQQPAPQQVHLRYILALTCNYRCPRYSAAHAPRGRAAQRPDTRRCNPPGAVVPTRWLSRPGGHTRQRWRPRPMGLVRRAGTIWSARGPRRH